MLIAMRADVFDQMLAVALHPLCECNTAMVSVNVIENLTKSPETHVSIVREEVVEKMLKIQKTFDEQLSAQSSSEDRMEISVLKYVAIIGHFSTPFISTVKHFGTQKLKNYYHMHCLLSLSLPLIPPPPRILPLLNFFLITGSTLALHWLRLDSVLHIFCLIAFHFTFCNRFSI